MGTAYRIAAASIVSEVIDGEAIIMDVASGTYYSADGIGASIWQALSQGWTRSDMIGWTQASFHSQSGCAAAVSEFIDRLVSSGLLRPEEAVDRVSPELAPMICAYAPPRLQVHTDMQDLIMIDPIHDVDEVGWPVRKAEAGH